MAEIISNYISVIISYKSCLSSVLANNALFGQSTLILLCIVYG